MHFYTSSRLCEKVCCYIWQNFQRVALKQNLTLLYCQKCKLGVNDEYLSYRKVPKFSDARKLAVINLKFRQRGQTVEYFVKKKLMK